MIKKCRASNNPDGTVDLYIKTSGNGGLDKNIEKRARSRAEELGLLVGKLNLITKSVPDAMLGRCNIVNFDKLEVTLRLVERILRMKDLTDTEKVLRLSLFFDKP